MKLSNIQVSKKRGSCYHQRLNTKYTFVHLPKEKANTNHYTS